MGKLKTLGVRESSVKEVHREEVERDGFTVIRGCLSSSEAAQLKAVVNDHIAGLSPEDVSAANALGDRGIHRALFCTHSEFAELLLNPRVKGLVDHFLDEEYHLYSQVVAVSNPDEQLNQVGWHREIFYQHFVSSRPLAVQSIFVLDKFNADTGGTLFLPGSHLFEEFPGDGYVEKHGVQPELEPGDCVVMNSMVYHRSGENRVLKNRALVTNTFVRPFISTQFDYTRMVQEPNSDALRQILGFRWNSKMTLEEWKVARLARLKLS